MNPIFATLGWMGRHGTGLSAAAVFVGLSSPDLSAWVRPWLGFVVASLLTLALTATDPRAVTRAFARPAPLLAAGALLCLATPLLFAALRPIFEPALGPGLMLGLFVFAFAPPTLSSPAFAALMGLEAAHALALCLGLTLAAPLLVPLVAALAGIDFPVDPWRLAGRLVLIVAPAAVAATLLRRWVGPARLHARREVITGLMIIPLVIFAIGSMDGMAARIAAETAHMTAILALAVALAACSLALVTALLWGFGRRIALPLGWCAGNRNLGLLIGALSGIVPPDTWSYFALAQFPIYALPFLAAPIYRRLAGDKTRV